MKLKKLIIIIAFLLFLIVFSFFLMPSQSIKETLENNVLGNDYTNLLVGGKVAKQGDIVYYSGSSKNGLLNNISTYNLRTKKPNC